MIVFGFLGEMSIVLITEEGVVVWVLIIVVVFLVEHIFMTVGVITVGISSVGVKTAVILVV